MKKVSEYKDTDGRIGYHFHCLGCNSAHGVFVTGNGPRWTFNGNEESPTFSPSILVRWTSIPKIIEKDEKGEYILQSDGKIKGAKDMVCHSFVTDGKIKFLGDCTHELKNQTVDLPDF